MTAAEVIERIKTKFPAPAFCFLEQVANGTGARARRWADGVAMSVWPSRGYEIHGIEVKVSRYDWVKELNDPEKSSAVQKYCDRWWVATSEEKIVQPGELPPTWGWMVANGKGMKVLVEAPKLTPSPLDYPFLASVLRNMATADETKLKRAQADGHKEGFESGGKYHQERYAELKKHVDEFEAASGIKIEVYCGGKALGEAVNTFRTLGWQLDRVRSGIEACRKVEEMLHQIETLADFKNPVEP